MISVEILIIEDNKVLLKRNEEKYQIPNTMLKDNELLKECAIRTGKENGIDLEPFAMLGVYDDIKRYDDKRVVGITYLCRYNAINNKELIFIPIQDIINNKISLMYDHAKIINNYFLISQFTRNKIKDGIDNKNNHS